MITQEAFNGGVYRAQTVVLAAGISTGLLLKYRVIILLGTATSCTLPPANALPLGCPLCHVINETGHNLTLQDNTGTTVCVLSNNETAIVGLYSNSNAAGKWAVIQRFNSALNRYRPSRAGVPYVPPTTPAVHCTSARYILTDCAGGAPALYTNTDFSNYVGKVVFLVEHPGFAWQIALYDGLIPAGSILEQLTIAKKTGTKTVFIRTKNGFGPVLQIVTTLDVFDNCAAAALALTPIACPAATNPFLPKKLLISNFRDIGMWGPPGGAIYPGWIVPPGMLKWTILGFTFDVWQGDLYIDRSTGPVYYSPRKPLIGSAGIQFLSTGGVKISCDSAFFPPGAGSSIVAWTLIVADDLGGVVYCAYRPVNGTKLAGVWLPFPATGPNHVNDGSYPYNPANVTIIEA